jgi:hypothetical protein
VAFLALLVALGQAGCGGSKGTVSGTVYYKDAPLKGGTVTFVGKDNASFLAEIGEDGSYALAKVPPGEVSITVETSSLRPPNPNVMRNRPPADAQGGYKPPDYEEKAKRFTPIPGRYADPGQSGLKYTVKSGKQQHDIKLEG